MSDAVTTMQKIREHAKESADDSARQVDALAPGDHVAQGDVIFWPMEKLPADTSLAKPQQQLAEGETQGSRHTIADADMKSVTFHKLSDPNELQGPILELDQGITVEHPEHGNLRLPQGLWFVTYQRAHAEELKKRQD